MAGKIAWIDLTVDDAQGVRNFYEAVLGWKSEGASMGDYEDFNMSGSDPEPVAGICHARGSNAGIPPVWMIYVTVEDLPAAMAACVDNGGEIVRPPKEGGSSCIIRDPAGAVMTLYAE